MNVDLFIRTWIEKGLSIHDLNRLVRAKRTCSVPDELGRLATRGIQLTSEEAYSLIAGVYLWAEKVGFWPLDGAKDPEEFSSETDDLPTCVLATSESTYIDYNDMARILALFDGTNIPDWVPHEERQNRIRRQRRRPVLTATCREEGCDETIVVTVGMAARAIREHKLLESGDVYEPSTLCKKHRAERDKMLAEKRRGGTLRVPLAEAARKGKNRFAKPKKEEDVSADQGASAAPAVTEEQATPPPQLAEELPQAEA